MKHFADILPPEPAQVPDGCCFSFSSLGWEAAYNRWQAIQRNAQPHDPASNPRIAAIVEHLFGQLITESHIEVGQALSSTVSLLPNFAGTAERVEHAYYGVEATLVVCQVLEYATEVTPTAVHVIVPVAHDGTSFNPVIAA